MASNLSEIQLKIVAGIDGLVEIGKLINELDALGGQSTESSAEVEKLVSELDSLRQQDKLISEFQTLKKETSATAEQMDEARARATALGKGLADTKQQVTSTSAEYRASKAATQALSDEWQTAKVKVDLLSKGIKDSTSPTREQRDELKAAKEQAKQLGEQYRASSKETTTLEKALRSTEQAVKLQTREFNAARKEVNQLDEQYLKQSGTLNGLRSELQQSGLNTKNLSAAQKDLKQTTSQVQAYVSALAADLKDQVERQKSSSDSVQTGEARLRSYSSEAQRAAKSTKDLGDKADDSAGQFSGWAKGIVASVAALLTIDKAKDAIVDLVSTSADMAIMEKNAKRAGLAFDELNQFAADTSLQLTEVMDVAIKTKNYGLDPMAGALQAATDAAAASGKGYEQVDGILTALGQAYTKTKLQQEEMNQLAERGIPAWSLLAEATGKSVPQLQDLASAGKLGRDEIKLLISAIGKEYVGAAKAAMDNTKGLASNLGDEFTRAKNEVASAGLMEYVNSQMRDTIDYIKQLRESGTLKEWGKELADAMRKVGDYTRIVVSNIQSMVPAIKLMAEAWIGLKIAKWISDLRLLNLSLNGLTVEAYKSADGITKSALASELAVDSFGKLAPAVRASTAIIGAFKTGLTGLAASWGIEKILEAIDAWHQMRDAQEAAEKSQKAAAISSFQLKSRLAEISKQVGINITSMKQFNQLLDDGVIHLDEASGLYQKGAKSIAAIGDATEQTDTKLTAFYSKIDELKTKLTTLKPASDEAAKVVTQMFDEMEAGSRKSVSFIITQLTEMEKKGTVTGTAIEAGLAAKLKAMSASDLVKFQQSLTEVGGRLDDVGEKAKSAGDKLSNELFSRLGIDLDEMRSGFSTAGKETIKVFGEIAQSGKYSSSEVKAAFEKSIDSAKTKKEADILTGIYQAAAASGVVSATDLKLGLEKTIGTTKLLAAETNKTGDAYDALGIKSAAALEKIAADHKAAFEEIQRSTASIELVKQAFMSYAEAELKAAQANDRYANGALSAQAATLGLSNEFSALQTSVNTTGKEALVTAAALDTLGSSAAKAGSNVSQASSSVGKHADDMKKLQEHTREASSGQLTFADTMLKSSEVTSMSLDTINTKMTEAREIWESSYNYLLKSNDLSTEWWSPFVEKQLLAQKHNMQILEQMQNLKVATEALSSAELPTARLVANAERAVRQADLLDSETLANFRAAIDSARQKMESLNSSASSTLSNLRDELDQMNQNYAAVEERRYQTQVADLRAKLAEAQSAGSKAAVSDLEQALSLAEQIHQKNMANIKAEEQEKRAQAAQTAAASKAQAQTTAQPAAAQQVIQQPVATSQPKEVIEFRLGPSAVAVQVDKSDKSALLSMINEIAAAKSLSIG